MKKDLMEGSGPQAVPLAQHVLLLGATGTVGRASLRALLACGHKVTCFVRERSRVVPWPDRPDPDRLRILGGALLDPRCWAEQVFGGERVDAVLSCLASRTGAPADAWAIDHQAHVLALEAARRAGVRRMVLLSAICVQKPQLEFQRAKLAFEQRLIDSGLSYSIVRPTAFFKSLSGQVDRVRAGRPFMVFGDGRLTACKPIDDDDLAGYLADCLSNPARFDRILPIGGPGPAITPREQGERLFEMLGVRPRFRQVPVRMMDAIVAGLGWGGRWLPRLAERAEFARIGRYYATESMLVWDPLRQCYDADATPSTGTRTLWDHYDDLIAGRSSHERGEHSVF
jgi:divinyl chlorophyllide a 8-vinyl-reductase